MNLISLRGVTARHGDRRVLDAVDLDLASGERLALLGANGAGKSTLLHTIVGLVPLAAGSIAAFGAARRVEADFREVRLRAGLVFQDADDQLFCPTVIEDVAFGPVNLGLSESTARARAMETLAQLSLLEFADRVTHRLSGGEKRLVALATVLAMQPEVLLLDEPTTGLDETAEKRLLDVLGNLPQAMILVSHDVSFLARLATRAMLLKDGRVVPGEIHIHPHAHEHAHFHFAGAPHHR
jgi:cobalt/nickel transport system ATP-binding protein